MMFVFFLQSLLLIAIAFVLGAICGALARTFFASPPAPSVPAARPTATEPAKPAAPAQSQPAAKAEPLPPADDPKPAAAKPARAAKAKPSAAKTAATKSAASKSSSKSVPAKAPAKKAAKSTPKSTAKPKATKSAQPAASDRPDDLKKIKGIGPQNEKKLNALGITTYAQIAAWTGKDAEDWGERLAFPGRIEREDWVGQARALAKAKS